MPLALPPARRSRATLVSAQQALQPEQMFAYVFTFEVAEGCSVLIHVD